MIDQCESNGEDERGDEDNSAQFECFITGCVSDLCQPGVWRRQLIFGRV